MSDDRFVSYAQNGEDVVLWRALSSVTPGRYVEVGANDPTVYSISRAFYDRGWSGVEIEPVPALAEAFRASRPRDVVVQAAITSDDVDEAVLHVVEDTGLSTLRDDIGVGHARSGWSVEDVRVPARRLDSVLAEHIEEGEDIHFLVIDVEGAERKVLESVDLTRWRPWVVVVEATAPGTDVRTHGDWEDLLVGSDYSFCLFDGLSRWYVAREHEELSEALDHPACPHDGWVDSEAFEATRRLRAAEEELQAVRAELEVSQGQRNALVEEVVRWRGEVLARWSAAAVSAIASPGAGGVPSHESARLRAELDGMQRTLSWRVTAPLRKVRTAQLRGSRRA